jgi:hypothetical protein
MSKEHNVDPRNSLNPKETPVQVDALRMIEEEELRIGSNFHAFRFNSIEVPETSEALTLIEEEELRIGSNFHAFRFNTI